MSTYGGFSYSCGITENPLSAKNLYMDARFDGLGSSSYFETSTANNLYEDFQ